VCFNIQSVTENGKIVALQCGSFHVGILNSAGEVFLGGDPDTGKLGITTAKYYGMKKLKSEHVFSSMAIFGDSTVLGSLDGTLLAYGAVTGYNTTANKFETKYPPIANVSGQGRDITICTVDGQVFVHNEDDGTRVEKGNYDTRFNVLSATTTYISYVCLAAKKNEVLNYLQLLTKTIHRDEFKDITIVQ
jgi:alpha-tubulin suppressor-like RCC1 family protein